MKHHLLVAALLALALSACGKKEEVVTPPAAPVAVPAPAPAPAPIPATDSNAQPGMAAPTLATPAGTDSTAAPSAEKK